VRDVDRLGSRQLAGTEGARSPFWSPDSRFIGFTVQGEVKKISLQGGSAITLCSARGTVFSGSWSPDGESVVFSGGRPGSVRIFEVAAQGGESRLLFEPEETAKGSGNSDPHFLPAEAGARSLLLRVGRQAESDVVLKNLETGESLILAEGEQAVYSPSGHIVYNWRDGLWALPFSLEALKATGEAFPIAENGSEPSIANDGTLVSVGSARESLDQLVWRGRTGEKIGEIGQPKRIRHLALSPDGHNVAVASGESGNQDIWVHEVERPLARRLTFDETPDTRPQWSPSGHEITFSSQRGGSYDIFRRATDGTGQAELLVGTDADERPWGWSHDGNYLIYTAGSGRNGDLWYLKREGDADGFEPVEFLATPFNEKMPRLSPDGDLLAYCSDQSDGDQVYVRPFPSGDGLSQASTNGGCQPRWSRDGKKLFYVEGSTLMAVEVTTSPVFEAGVTTPLFSDPQLRSPSPNDVTYDVSADGRFVMSDSAESSEEEQPSILVTQNWYEEFRGRE